KARLAKERERNTKVAQTRPVAVTEDMSWRELRHVMDEELQRLPEKYRAAVVLCCLEGKSRDEAAEALGWSMNTVKSCLEAGRGGGRGAVALAAGGAGPAPAGAAARFAAGAERGGRAAGPGRDDGKLGHGVHHATAGDRGDRRAGPLAGRRRAARHARGETEG